MAVKMKAAPPCANSGCMRDGEIALDTLITTAGSDQMEIRFASAIKGIGCFVHKVTNGTYTVRMRAYDSGGSQLGSSHILHDTTTNAYSGGAFEDSAFVGIAFASADAAQIARVDINVVAGHIATLTDADFNAASEARYVVGQLIFGTFDPPVPVGPPAGVAGRGTSCGPALFSGSTCLPFIDPKILARPTLVPTTHTLRSGVASAALAECGNPLTHNPCDVESD